MARPRQVDMELVAQAQMLALEAETLEDLRCAQAVLLPALLDATLEETAAVMGVGRATVPRYQARLRKRLGQPAQPPPKWGGRRRASMSEEEERSFLAPWAKLSEEGGMLVVSPLRASLSQRLGRPVAASVAYRLLARHGWRKVAPDTRHPKSDPAAQEEWKKKAARSIGGLAETARRSRSQGAPDVPGRSAFRAHGAHSPLLGANPGAPGWCATATSANSCMFYGAVSPLEGQLDWMITRQMNTADMSAFLAQVHARHRRDFMVMVVDGASAHVAKDLVVPENIRLLRLPPYAPELNPQEHVWDELREKEFPNRVFADLQSVLAQLEAGLPRLASNRRGLRSLTARPCIVSLNLNAH